jgi:ring-1,2-phenylacetyl-CoA epoxidase subunit PaaE
MIKAYILTISNVVQETPDAVTLQFSQPAFGRIWYHPGQFITMRIEVEGKYHFRSYSLSSTPQLDSFLAVTVKRVPGGLISSHIVDHFKPGQQIEVLNPRGKFYLKPGIKKRRNIFLFAGGSGITPIMGILKAVLFQEPSSKVTLLLGNRSETDIIFKDQLALLVDRFSTRFQVFHFLSQPENPENTAFITGRMQPNKIREVLSAPHDFENSEYYICGPTAMMEMVKTTLYSMEVDSESIHQEEFIRDIKEEKTLKNQLGRSHTVEVEVGTNTYKITVPPGVSILDAALSQNLPIPYSCRRGVCSTCMGKIVSGQVEMIDEDSLLDFEKEQGFVLVCQSHPTSEGIKIRMGYEFTGQ